MKTRDPSPLRALVAAALLAASCSMADTISVALPSSARTAPWIANASASVPPLVNRMSAAREPIAAPTWALPFSITARAARPDRCTDEGLAAPSASAVRTASRASGRIGAVAL